MSAPMIDVVEAARRFRAGEAVLLDVREASELARVKVDGAIHVPMREVVARLQELPREKPILVMCHHGGRSQAVADWLAPKGFDVVNVAGGIDAWATDVDTSLARY